MYCEWGVGKVLQQSEDALEQLLVRLVEVLDRRVIFRDNLLDLRMDHVLELSPLDAATRNSRWRGCQRESFKGGHCTL